MTRASKGTILGYRAHAGTNYDRVQTSYEPMNVPSGNGGFGFHLARGQYQPFDRYRHCSHMAGFPAAQTLPIKGFTPQNGGFWQVGTGLCG